MYNFLLLTLLALCVTSTTLAAPSPVSADWRPSSRCKPTSKYPGWEKIKHAFIFGNSYTTTGFNATSTQPSTSNPLGNPPYPGYTSSNGPNWVDFLTVKYNASQLLSYNLAYSGATVDSSLVAPYLPTVLSLSAQIESEFFPLYSSSSFWSPEDTLFSVFIGINDVGNSYGKGAAATESLNNAIFAVYDGLLQMLYQAGARNFLLLNVPPVDRSPLTSAQGAAAQGLEKADIAAFNGLLSTLADGLKDAHADANVFTVDTNALFTAVVDKPSSYAQTAGYRNMTAYCVAYENGTPAEDTFIPSCGIPVNQYFWLNGLHPTYPMQDVLAQEVAKTLQAGPNVC